MRNALLACLVLVILITFGCASRSTSSQTPLDATSTVLISEQYERVNLPQCTTGIVETKNGRLCGSITTPTPRYRVNAYLGIPFAESTAGENRWRAPVPVKPWRGVLKATAFGPGCPQLSQVSPQSEDCLTINVWTPAGASPEPIAVMVFIYGGAFVYGASSDALYNGAYAAAHGDVVVVSFNYRLGALGFLAGIKDKETGEELQGNYGFQDQILALKWVRDNIGAFGGDPDKVTLWGESAGAMSIGLHLVSSPGSKGLYRAAIMESNPLGIPYKTLKASHAIAKRFASDLGCGSDDIKCMRGKLAEVVLDTQSQKNLAWPLVFHGISDLLFWAPVIDREVITEQPITAISKGNLKTPYIIGTNKNEGVLFIEIAKAALGKKSFSALDYKLMTDFIIPDHDLRKEIYKLYPPVDGDNTKVISRVATDYLFVCAARFTASHSSPRTWAYAFDKVSTFNIWPKTPGCADAVCHGDELPYVFHTAGGRGFKFTPPESRLSDMMIHSWTTFAKELDPSSQILRWPAFGKDSLRLVFNTPVYNISTVTTLGANCPLWDQTGYDLHDSFWGVF